MEWQREILNLLIDRRERSRAYRERGKVHRRVTVLPAEVYPEYESGQDSAGFD